MLDFTELPKDGIRFEQLIRELLLRTGFEVHWTGVGPDGGRDLVFVERAEGALAAFSRKWLVSCKHHAGTGSSVGVSDISGIVDACEAVGAQAFLLACSTQPSSGVVRRLEEVQQQGKLITRYWDGVEVDRRLSRPDAYALRHAFFPVSSQANPWLIYATLSPSLWAAHHQGYFVYLASRTAHAFPELADVEEIIRRLESITLPHDEPFHEQYLRPRAVYFDDKHEQYTVYVDYLFPKGDADDSRMSSDELRSLLKDGQGLYSGGEAMWKLTTWDILCIPTDQVSDHFHVDHKDYYQQYIELFRIGYPRSGLLDQLAEAYRHASRFLQIADGAKK